MLSRRTLMRTLRMFILTVAVLGLLAFAYWGGGAAGADSMSGKWVSPASSAAKKNPIAPLQSSLAAGQKIYLKRCAACHGNAGNGDGPDAADLGIHPAKFSDPTMREETDGELFWKITVGKKPMPGYGTRLSPTDRWNVINYLRTLAKEVTKK
ncbi:MAG: cytochrome c class I [Verrucomicrobia bacterium]|nr:MAG: cytochrome c class I [Verrucomicrobiota bacterium]